MLESSVMVRRVKYVYDYEFRLVNRGNGPEVLRVKTPVACIVSDGTDYGVSTCCRGSANRGEDVFCKDRAREVAEGRMLSGAESHVPNRKLRGPYGQKTTLLDEVEFWVERMTGQTV